MNESPAGCEPGQEPKKRSWEEPPLTVQLEIALVCLLLAVIGVVGAGTGAAQYRQQKTLSFEELQKLAEEDMRALPQIGDKTPSH